MNNKGFTFIELLAVMVLIVMLGLIVFPSVTNLIKQSSANKEKAFYNDVYIATEAYIQENIQNYPQLNSDDGIAYVYMGELVASNYLKSSLINPSNNKRISTCTNGTCTVDPYTIIVTKTDDGTYSYTLENGIHKNKTILEVAKELVYSNGTCKTDNTYMGGCYLKGSQTTNYVLYNGYVWRIMGINSDDSVRLITDKSTTSLVYTATNSYLLSFYLNLNSTKSIILNDTYCIDSSTLSSSRITCSKTTLNDFSLLTIDEYNLSGTSSYLNSSENYWTITSYSDTNIWYISSTGTTSNNTNTNIYGVRPVISVNGNASITNGDGTSTNNYLLSIDQTNAMNGTIGDTCKVK